jgi:uncharacterized protein YkwD
VKNKIIIFIFAVGLLFQLHTPIVKADAEAPGISAEKLIELTNKERESLGLSKLKENAVLDKVAKLKAENMAKLGYFAHNSPTGKTPWYWFQISGYKYKYAGENLAILYDTSEEVTEGWMTSPKHKENIVNTKFREIGMAVVQGTYNGRKTSYVVEVFGTTKNNTTLAVRYCLEKNTLS